MFFIWVFTYIKFKKIIYVIKIINTLKIIILKGEKIEIENHIIKC